MSCRKHFPIRRGSRFTYHKRPKPVFHAGSMQKNRGDDALEELRETIVNKALSSILKNLKL
jgi:hypothetical protein